MVIGNIVRNNANLFPNKKGVVDENRTLTWGEVNQRVNRLADAIIGLGLKKGDRAAMIAENCHQCVEFLFAVAKVGVLGVFFNYRLTPQDLESVIKDCKPRVIIAQDKFLSTINKTNCETGSVDHVIALGEGDAYEQLIEAYDSADPQIELSEQDTYILQYTTGSTGKPKAVELTHKNVMNNCIVRFFFGRQPEDCVYMSPGAFFAIGSLGHVFAAAFIGATLVIPRFSGQLFVEMIEREKVTYTYLNPTTFRIVRDFIESSEKRYDLSSLRDLAIGGGQPCTADQALEILDYFHIPYQHSSKAYGQSEIVSAAMFLLPSDMGAGLSPGATEREREKVNSVGKPLGNTQVRVVDENGQDVPPRTEGEILLKGDGIMKGYWKRPDLTEEVLKEGWYYTRDMGYLDEDGYLYFVDQKDFLIKSGGLFVSPMEVEKILKEHPAVADAAVIGPLDEKWGQRVVALAKLKPCMEADEEGIRAFCREHLARFKVPKSVTFIDEIPRETVYGKINRKELLRLYGNVLKFSEYCSTPSTWPS